MKPTRALLLLLLLLAAPSFAARTLVVDKEGGDFKTVAEALKEVKAGDTVFIRAHGDALIDLVPGVVYVSDGKSAESLDLKALKDVTLRGFRLKSLSCAGCIGVTVEKCRVESGGIVIKASKGVSVRDCAFVKPDPSVAAERVRAEFSQGVTLDGNLILSAHTGVVLLDAEATLTRNTITGALYTGKPLDPNDLAEAHDAQTAAQAVLIQCNPSMMEAWDKRKAVPAQLGENVIAGNERGIVVDRCAKGNSSLKVHHNLFHDNKGFDYVAVTKQYKGASFSYVLEEILAKGRLGDSGNKFVDPLFANPAKGDYALAGESPAARMAAGGGAVGAPAAVAEAAKK